MQQMSFDFTTQRRFALTESSNDYHRVPASEKQIAYARLLATRLKTTVPQSAIEDRRALSSWIDQNKDAAPKSRFAQYPSSKQVAYAERIARIKRRAVPDACFKDRTLMSRWIDSNA